MRFEMLSMPREEFEEMRARLPKATSEGLFDTYRISQNTWYKLRDGEPVKRTTIDRLRLRFHQVAGK
jgi:hypothetical protein